MKSLGSFVLASAALTLGAGCWPVPTASSFIPSVPSISTPSISTPSMPSISTPSISTPTDLAPGMPRPPSLPGPPGLPQPPSPW